MEGRIDEVLDVLGSGPLTEEQARTIVAMGAEVAVFAILELSKQLAEQRPPIASTGKPSTAQTAVQTAAAG